jgi:hypothetical protein
MKRFALISIFVFLLLVIISGIIPHEETVYGKSCGWSFDAQDSVCHPVPYTWLRHGWLVKLVTGCKTVGVCSKWGL